MADRILLSPHLKHEERHYFTTNGDLSLNGIPLKNGAAASFYDGDASEFRNPDNLLFEGTVYYDSDLCSWYALLDWDSFRHESDEEKKHT